MILASDTIFAYQTSNYLSAPITFIFRTFFFINYETKSSQPNPLPYSRTHTGYYFFKDLFTVCWTENLSAHTCKTEICDHFLRQKKVEPIFFGSENFYNRNKTKMYEKNVRDVISVKKKKLWPLVWPWSEVKASYISHFVCKNLFLYLLLHLKSVAITTKKNFDKLDEACFCFFFNCAMQTVFCFFRSKVV